MIHLQQQQPARYCGHAEQARGQLVRRVPNTAVPVADRHQQQAATALLVSPTSGLSFPSPVTTTPPSLTLPPALPPPPQSPPAATAAAIPTLAATFFLDSFHPLSGSTPSVLRPPSRLVTFISFAVTRYAETATSKQMMSYKALTISTGGK
uniref:Uncharacterized protein n=1 Tax=Vespula pensylvanica TaxID=30213 RepID=A0A834JJ59_VESPE|nr:hypothetical protein H0235_018212 [Vespula pensylvanica]